MKTIYQELIERALEGYRTNQITSAEYTEYMFLLLGHVQLKNGWVVRNKLTTEE